MISSTPLAMFVDSLTPKDFERSTASQRRQALAADLATSTLKVSRLFESGSWSHGTALAGHSDVDYMAAATSNRPIYPSSALAAAKAAINTSRLGTWRVRVSSPTVKIDYFSGPDIEVVPAFLSRIHDGNFVYWIPGPGDEWVESAPRSHLQFVSAQNDRLGKKVKPLIRLLKQWKVANNVPVSSFYLEMRAAGHARGEGSIVYLIDICSIMAKLVDHRIRSINDPAGVVTRIHGVSSEDNRRVTLGLMQDALAKLNTAYSLAETSANAGYYYSLMKDVFGDGFCYPMWS